jgi:hypothetical protein
MGETHAFLLPVALGEDDPTHWTHQWAAVGIPITLIPVTPNKEGALTHLSFCARGQYAPHDQGTRIYAKEGLFGTTTLFSEPDTVLSEMDRYWSQSKDYTLLKNTVWPMEMAMKLSVWYPRQCNHLCGWTENGEIWEVRKGERVVQLPAVPDFKLTY